MLLWAPEQDLFYRGVVADSAFEIFSEVVRDLQWLRICIVIVVIIITLSQEGLKSAQKLSQNSSPILCAATLPPYKLGHLHVQQIKTGSPGTLVQAFCVNEHTKNSACGFQSLTHWDTGRFQLLRSCRLLTGRSTQKATINKLQQFRDKLLRCAPLS